MSKKMMYAAKLAVALGVLMSFSAYAEISVVGLVDVGFGVNQIVQGQDAKAQFYSGADNGNSEGNSTTRLGLKGDYVINSDLKLNYQLVSNGITSSGSVNSPMFARAAWVGVSGHFGEFRLGRQDSIAWQVQSNFDMDWGSNSSDAFVYAMVAADLPGRQSAVLNYLSPKLGDYTTLRASYKPADGTVGSKSTVALGVNYDNGPFSLGVAGETARTTTSQNFASIAASYDFKLVKLVTTYANGGNTSQGGTGNGWGLGISAPVGGVTVGSMVGYNQDTKDRAVEFFLQKTFDKNLYGYINVMRANLQGANMFAPAGQYTNYGVGTIYTF